MSKRALLGRHFKLADEDGGIKGATRRRTLLRRAIHLGLDSVFGIYAVERVKLEVAQLRHLFLWPINQAFGAPVEHGACAASIDRAPTGRSVLRLIRRTATLAIAAPITAYAAIAVGQAIGGTAYPSSYWVDSQNAMLRPPVLDAQRGLIGFLPLPEDTDLGSKFAIRTAKISQACIDLVLLQEDRYFGDPMRHWGGVDAVGLLRGVVGIGGGSTLAMQMVRMLDPKLPHQPKLVRKAQEIAAARAVVEAFGGDPKALAHAYLSVATFGLGHGSLLGLYAAADVFFGTRPEMLNAAQCAVLVAQLPRPISLHRRDDPDVLKAWESNLRRAKALLGRSTNPAFREAAKEVDAWVGAIPLRAPIEGAGEGARLNLGVRTAVFVNRDAPRIRAETAALQPEALP